MPVYLHTLAQLNRDSRVTPVFCQPTDVDAAEPLPGGAESSLDSGLSGFRGASECCGLPGAGADAFPDSGRILWFPVVRARTTRRYYDFAPIARLFSLSKSTQVSWTRRDNRCPFSNCTSVLIHLWIKVTHFRTTWVSTSWILLALAPTQVPCIPSAKRGETTPGTLQHNALASRLLTKSHRLCSSRSGTHFSSFRHVSVTLVQLCDMFTTAQNEPSAPGTGQFSRAQPAAVESQSITQEHSLSEF